jgi:hypothetical protein
MDRNCCGIVRIRIIVRTDPFDRSQSDTKINEEKELCNAETEGERIKRTDPESVCKIECS